MNKESQNILKQWITELIEKNKISNSKKIKVADIGSFNINGTVKNTFAEEKINCEVTGFDLVKGDNVDVVISCGTIPEKYKHKFEFVTCMSAFDYGCNNCIIRELLDISKQKANILLSVQKDINDGKNQKNIYYHYRKNTNVMTHSEFVNFIKNIDVLEIRKFIKTEDSLGENFYFITKK
jgi:hypothetical protein